MYVRVHSVGVCACAHAYTMHTSIHPLTTYMYSGVGRYFLIGGLETDAMQRPILIPCGAEKDLFLNHNRKKTALVG